MVKQEGETTYNSPTARRKRPSLQSYSYLKDKNSFKIIRKT
jgi:hypothetical protein